MSRVVLVSRIFSPEPAAASFRLAALADALHGAGAAVTVLTTRAPARMPASANAGVTVRRWPVLRDRTGYVRGYLQYLSFDIPLVFRLLAIRSPDVVVVEPPPTTGIIVRLVCQIRRIPYVYYAADIWSDAAGATRAPALVVTVVRAMERAALAAADHVIAVTDGVAARVLELSGNRSVTVVGHGVDTDLFSGSGPGKSDGPIAVYTGTASEWHGAEIFIRAMPIVRAAMPDAHLVFIGQGSEWEALQNSAATLVPDGVAFVDVVPPEEASAWLRSAVFAVASLKPEQGYDFAFPTKIYAALATGTPVLFTGKGPAAELMRFSELGLAVDFDVKSVADSMIEMFRHPAGGERRAVIAAWAQENASLRHTANAAATVILHSRRAARQR